MADVLETLEGSLSRVERGFLVGVVLSGQPLTDDPAGMLAEPSAARCRQALEALAALPRAERVDLVKRLAGKLLAPPAARLERAHPGWLRRAMEEEPTGILLAVTEGLPAAVREVAAQIIEGRGEEPATCVPDEMSEEGRAELQRVVFGHLIAMPTARELAAHALAPPLAARLLEMSHGDLLAEVDRLGAETLGISLQGAPREVLARTAAHVGDPWGRVVIEFAQGAHAADQREPARRLVGSLDVSDTGLPVTSAIGLAGLREELSTASDEIVVALAQRLPPTLGQSLLRNLL
jgi:hypothetical protein